jgi:hypothetical protein
MCYGIFQSVFTRFRNIAKAIISFVMSVHLSVRMEQLGSQWMAFHELLY